MDHPTCLAQYEAALDRERLLKAQVKMLEDQHKHLTQQNALLRQRPDLPVDRIPAVNHLDKLDRERRLAEGMLGLSQRSFKKVSSKLEIAEEWISKLEAQVDRVIQEKLHLRIQVSELQRIVTRAIQLEPKFTQDPYFTSRSYLMDEPYSNVANQVIATELRRVAGAFVNGHCCRTSDLLYREAERIEKREYNRP